MSDVAACLADNTATRNKKHTNKNLSPIKVFTIDHGIDFASNYFPLIDASDPESDD